MMDFAPTSAILPFDPELLALCQAIAQHYRELPDLNFAELRRDRGNITDQQFEAEEATYDQCVVGIRAEMNKIFELAQLDLQRLQAFMHASHLALVRLRDILDGDAAIEEDQSGSSADHRGVGVTARVVRHLEDVPVAEVGPLLVDRSGPSGIEVSGC